MTPGEFKKRFELASCFCRDFTGRHLIDHLPDSLRFHFTIARLTDKKTVEINDSVYKTDDLFSVKPSNALKYLYSDGRIPSWIDLYVDEFDVEHTYIAVTFSREFTDDENLFYKRNSKLPPFKIIGPTIPENWISLEESGPFSFIPFS